MSGVGVGEPNGVFLYKAYKQALMYINMKRDPYNHKERFEKWIISNENCKRINELSEINSKLFLLFIKDLKVGLNVSRSSKKGERSFIRLNTIRGKLAFVLRKIEERGIKDIRKVSSKDMHNLFADMRAGIIQTRFGTHYKSTGDYVKEFKTFWHWYQKIMKKENKVIPDITENLDTRGEKPKFVYFTETDFKNILAEASYDVKPIISLAFDSGARITELFNVKVSDFLADFKELNIRDETSKTFGRRIKLMMCSEQIQKYIRKIELTENDYICRLRIDKINKELRHIAKRALTPDQIKYKNLTLKDFRHSSACFWLPRYKSESALKYRFGWIKSEMIHYYTEFLGMRDTIKEDDMYVDITKTALEKEVERLKNEINTLKVSVIRLIDVAKERKIIEV